ncbi:MAG: hypothetical protein IT293_07760 [Deltaproteobacteria bacterium]|nr:hypothetical protein [Deltaproteobacteria bacterium]
MRSAYGLGASADRAAALVVDRAVAEEAAALGIRSDTLIGLALVPLAAVAWADGRLDESERRIVLGAAADTGLGADGPGRRLLDRCLAAPPPGELWTLWRSYVASACATLSDRARRRWRDKVVADARRVAEAAGGFKSVVPKVSADEAALLDEIALAFTS